MPYEIRKVKGGYAVFNQDTGARKDTKKTFKSKKAAMPYFKKLWSVETTGGK